MMFYSKFQMFLHRLLAVNNVDILAKTPTGTHGAVSLEWQFSNWSMDLCGHDLGVCGIKKFENHCTGVLHNWHLNIPYVEMIGLQCLHC